MSRHLDKAPLEQQETLWQVGRTQQTERRCCCCHVCNVKSKLDSTSSHRAARLQNSSWDACKLLKRDAAVQPFWGVFICPKPRAAFAALPNYLGSKPGNMKEKSETKKHRRRVCLCLSALHKHPLWRQSKWRAAPPLLTYTPPLRDSSGNGDY